MNLSGKRILLVTPNYYGYEIEIKNALEARGARVSVIYENIVEYDLYYRMFFIYFPEKCRTVIFNYYKKHLNRINEKIDIVLAIRASSVDKDIFSLIKGYCKTECKYIMYQWDSVANNPQAIELAELFDDVFTFDIEDSKRLHWKYRPLFYINRLAKKSNIVTNRKIDVCYLCSWHSKRAQILRRLKNITKNNNLIFFYNMRASFVLFVKHKYINRNPEYNFVKFNEVSFKSISLIKCYELYRKSKVVIDYTHPGQTGLTMRTIECIGNECKLITNNKLIKNSDFYNENNILIYEGEDIRIPSDFVNIPYEPIEKYLYNYYSLEGWIDSLLG